MKNSILIILLLVLGFNTQAQCNWKAQKGITFMAKDSCDPNYYMYATMESYIVMDKANVHNYYYKWTDNKRVMKHTYSWIQDVLPNGSHDICVTIRDSTNKCDTTYCKTITINCKYLSIKGRNDFFKISPNPAKEQLLIDNLNPNFVIKEIRALGIDGKYYDNINFNKESDINKVNIQNLNSCLYILEITLMNGSIQYYRFIKE